MKVRDEISLSFYRRQSIKDTNLLWEELERGVVAATEDIWNVECVKLGVPRVQRCLNVLLCGSVAPLYLYETKNENENYNIIMFNYP